VNYSAQKTQANTNNEPSQRSQEDVLSIMDRMQSRGGMPAKLGKMPQMRQHVAGHVLPSIDPSSFVKRGSTRKKEQAPTINQLESPEKDEESPMVKGYS
jgi:hypothetical protein